MQNQALATTCALRSQPSEQPSRSRLIREWIAKLALNAGQAIDADAIGVIQALWEKGFADLSCDVIEAAFRKTLRECTFWPVKVADIRKHISSAKTTASTLAAEDGWNVALDFRRRYWRTDLPGQIARGAPKLPDRIMHSMHAAGVFVDYDSVEGLHVWAKKKFIEYFLAYGEMDQDKFLLPEGEIREMLKALTATPLERPLAQSSVAGNPVTAEEDQQKCTEIRERMKLTLPWLPRRPLEQSKPAPQMVDRNYEERIAKLREQAELIKTKYPATNLAQNPRDARPQVEPKTDTLSDQTEIQSLSDALWEIRECRKTNRQGP